MPYIKQFANWMYQVMDQKWIRKDKISDIACVSTV